MRISRFKLIVGLATVAVLFLLLGVYREHLIPFHADREQQLWLLTGDEPAYLLAARAFADGDGLDMWPAHERNEHLQFYDRDIMGKTQYSWKYYLACGHRPLLDRASWWGDKQIKHHMPGFPLLMAPFSRLHQFRWAMALSQALLICALATVLLWHVRGLPSRWFGGAALAVLCWLGCAPIAYYSTQAFPETTAGVFVLLALLLLSGQRPLPRVLGGGLLTATLWITPRMIGGVLLADVVLIFNAIRRRRWSELAVISVGVLMYFGYHLFIWGTFFPPAFDPANRIQTRLLLRGILICFFGNDVGLLFLNPALWIGVVATLLILLRHRDETVWVWGAVFVGCLLGVAMLPVWRAGVCPAGRYQVVIAYLLLLPTLRAFNVASDRWRMRLITSLGILGTVGIMIGLFMAQAPNFWFRDYNPLFGYKPLQPYYDWLPPSDPVRFGLKRYSLYWLLFFCATLGLYDTRRKLSFLLRGWQGRSRDPLCL